MLIEGLGIEPISLTEQGMPASDLPALKKLCGNPKKGDYGIIGKIDIFTWKSWDSMNKHIYLLFSGEHFKK